MIAIKCNNNEEFHKMLEHFMKSGYKKNFIFNPNKNTNFNPDNKGYYLYITLKNRVIGWNYYYSLKYKNYNFMDYKYYMRTLKLNKINKD